MSASGRLLLVGVAFVAAALALATPMRADEWTDFHFEINPASPSDQDTFDLRAWRWFPDSGFELQTQSISVNGYEINLDILVRDLHFAGGVFLTVMTPVGAYYEDFGPLPAGDYQVNAEMWMAFSPFLPALVLIDQATFHFTVTASDVPALLTGDYNHNGVVDLSDYTVWRDSFGEMGAGLAADGNRDELVDDFDYAIWKQHFGETAEPGGEGQITAAPEAGSLLLAAIAAMFVGCARRR